MSMNKNVKANRGVAFVLIALFLATIVFGTWVLFGPVWPSQYLILKTLDAAVFILTCASMILVVVGTHYIEKAGGSWITAILSTISIVANAIVLFYALYELITGSAGMAIRQ